MGRIVGSRRNNQKIIFEVELDYKEAVLLKGHYDNVHLFSENTIDFQTKISSRGKNDATKYFLIPTKYRKDLNLNSKALIQRIKVDDSDFLIYMLKNNLNKEIIN